jgi:hypothetical protein
MGNMTGVALTDSASAGFECVTMGDAANVLDIFVIATDTLSYERCTLYHPWKLCYFHFFEDISAIYFTKNI